MIIYPLECPNGSDTGHGCSNPEAIAPDLMVNKVLLEVDTRYSLYARCNIGVNGTDGMGHPCKDDTYCCFCENPGSYFPNATIPCNATLGRENIKQSHNTTCEEGDEEYRCYRDAVALKFTEDNPGYWYSSLTESYCPSGIFSPTCTWRVLAVEKVVQKSCHNNIFYGAVENYGQDCFNSCGIDVKNSSSVCWARCFYQTVLGPESGHPGGAVTGMPVQDLIAAWEKPFADEKDGGCPSK